MQNLGDLSHWEQLDAGAVIDCPLTRSRRVTLSVNAAEPVNLYFYPSDPDQKYKQGEGTFLARVDGLDEIQFRSPIDVAVVCDGPMSLKTDAGQIVQQNEAVDSFTTIHERQAVNPEVAAVMQRATANQRAMARHIQAMGEQIQQMQQQTKVKADERPAQPKPDDKSKGSDGDDGKAGKPKPTADGGAPVEAAAEGGEGDGAGKTSSG